MTTLNWTIEYMSASTQPIAGQAEVVLTAGWRCTGTETNTVDPTKLAPATVLFTSTTSPTIQFSLDCNV